MTSLSQGKFYFVYTQSSDETSQTMEIEDFFEEWDEDKDDNDLAELLEDNVRAVNTIEAEDSEDEDESESEDDGSTFKCSKCKKRYHLKAWLQKHENSCSGKEPTKKYKFKLSEHQKKTRKVLSSLGFDDFFTSKCVPSLITFLNKISTTRSETAKIRGSSQLVTQTTTYCSTSK